MTSAAFNSLDQMKWQWPLDFQGSDQIHLGISKQPLAHHALEIQGPNIEELTLKDIKTIYVVRQMVNFLFRTKGFENSLCYFKMEFGQPLKMHLVPYPSLPQRWDYAFLRFLYRFFLQSAVLLHTIYPPKTLSASQIEDEKKFWGNIVVNTNTGNITKTGSCQLLQTSTIQTQEILRTDHAICLYNYAPLEVGEHGMHLLIIPHPGKPAAHFLEMDEEQYVDVLESAKKLSKWANVYFKEKNLQIHCYDKSGSLAGQTQNVFHLHWILVEKEDTLTGKLKLFLRMIIPPRPLSTQALQERITKYKNIIKIS
jgi:diadenosine tetraphosphate (Ap4A) HIT family hydrolase